MSHEDEMPWTIRVEEDANGHWRQLDCILQVCGLAEALTGMTMPSPPRSANPASPTDMLILSDVVTIENHLTAINLLARRDPAAGENLIFDLLFNMEIERPYSLIATLRWGDHSQIKPIDAHGRAVFSDVRITDLYDTVQARVLTGLRITVAPSPLAPV